MAATAASLVASVAGAAPALATVAPTADDWQLVAIDAGADPGFVVFDSDGTVATRLESDTALGDTVAVGALGSAAIFRDFVTGRAVAVHPELGSAAIEPLAEESVDVSFGVTPALLSIYDGETTRLLAPNGGVLSVRSGDDDGLVSTSFAAGTAFAAGRTLRVGEGFEYSTTVVDVADPGVVELRLDGPLLALGPGVVATFDPAASTITWWDFEAEPVGRADVSALGAGSRSYTGLADGSVVIAGDGAIARVVAGSPDIVPISLTALEAAESETPVEVSVVALGGDRWVVLVVSGRSVAPESVSLSTLAGNEVTATVELDAARFRDPLQNDDRCVLAGEYDQVLIDADSGVVQSLADGGSVIGRSADGCVVAVRGTADHLLTVDGEVDLDGDLLAVTPDGRHVATRSTSGSAAVVDLDSGASTTLGIEPSATADLTQFVFVPHTS